MKRTRHNGVRAFRWLVLAAWLGLAGLAGAADSLQWDKERSRVSADISTWDLTRLLEELAVATEWQIFVEPTAAHSISTKFSDRSTGDALRLLLGGLNYALVPQASGISRLYVFRTSVQEATRQVRGRSKPKPIPNELIVILKPGENIDAIAGELGAEVVSRLDSKHAYRLRFKDEAAAAAARQSLENDSRVASVDSNYYTWNQPSPEGLALNSSPALKLKLKPVSESEQLTVGLIDTGINRECSPFADFFLPSISLPGAGAPPATGTLSHGDSMAQALLRGLATAMDGEDGTRVRILPVDVYGGKPATTSYDVARGVVEALNGGARIINLSLGSDGNMELLHQVIKDASSQGVLFFAAAGNEPTADPTFPAAYPEVIAVTAGTRDGQIAPYANYGSFVDAVAPGSVIARDCQGESWFVSGTSVSTAFAAGAAVGLADKTGQPLAGIAQAIRASLAPKGAK